MISYKKNEGKDRKKTVRVEYSTPYKLVRLQSMIPVI